MAKKKAAGLPSIQPEPQHDEVVVQESEVAKVAGDAKPQVQWVEIRVPVFTGDLGQAHIPDRMDAKLVGRNNKVAVKRISRGLDHEGVTLRNGKPCGNAVQNVAMFIVESVAEKLG